MVLVQPDVEHPFSLTRIAKDPLVGVRGQCKINASGPTMERSLGLSILGFGMWLAILELTVGA